ncbi:MAG: hypothetical protein ACI85E_001586 [Marinomonas primoryensis]|jgi:hypothetical protein
MKKMNIFQDIVHSLSGVLAVSSRPFIVLFLSFFVTIALSSSSIEPILNPVLFFSIVLTTLLLVGYLSFMININPARQKLAFFLTRVNTTNEYFSRAEARCMKRCRAPFFRFR